MFFCKSSINEWNKRWKAFQRWHDQFYWEKAMYTTNNFRTTAKKIHRKEHLNMLQKDFNNSVCNKSHKNTLYGLHKIQIYELNLWNDFRVLKDWKMVCKLHWKCLKMDPEKVFYRRQVWSALNLIVLMSTGSSQWRDRRKWRRVCNDTRDRYHEELCKALLFSMRIVNASGHLKRTCCNNGRYAKCETKSVRMNTTFLNVLSK